MASGAPTWARRVGTAGIAVLVLSSALGAAGYFVTALGFAAIGAAAVGAALVVIARRIERRAQDREGYPVRR